MTGGTGPEDAESRQRYPELITRTMRGGIVDPSDRPAFDPEFDDHPQIRVRPIVGPDGQARIATWMPQEVASRLIALLESGTEFELPGGAQDTAFLRQFADDLRALMRSDRPLDLPTPEPGTEQAN